MSRYTDVTEITPEERLQLMGLLVLGSQHLRMLNDIENAARAITGEDKHGHTSDEIWNDNPDVDRLLERLGISVADTEETSE